MKHLRKILLSTLVAVGLVVGGIAAPVYAVSQGTVAVAEQGGVVWHFDPVLTVSTIATVVLPIIVGLVTNSSWSSRAKGILHLVLSAVSGVLAELLDYLTNGGTFDVFTVLISAGATFGVGVAVYLGILSREGASGKPSIAARLAKIGA